MSGPGTSLRIFAGKIRRFVAVHFRKGYVRGRLRVREGECRQCAVCCSFWVRCPWLTKDGLCRVYDGRRPLACAAFPLDEKDLADVRACGGKCGYRFPKGGTEN